MLKKITILPQIIALVFIFSFAIFVFFDQKEGRVLASASDNVSGWAWSENIGWMSFNNMPNAPAVNYGVNIDPLTGSLSGYVWADNIGWVSFNRLDTGVPPASPYNGVESFIAKMDISGGKISGWARALTACKDNLWDNFNKKCIGVGAGNKAGGWDGWIKLAGDGASWNGSQCTGINNYNNNNRCNWGTKVDMNNGDFHGWAWGSDVLGWISFNSSDPAAGGATYKVVLNLSSLNKAPDDPFNLTENLNNCSVQGVSTVALGWDYNDNDGDQQDSYQVLISIDDAAFNPPDIDSCDIITSGGVNTCQPANGAHSYAPIPILSFNHAYHWKVRVKDTRGGWSNFSPPKKFDMPKHAYPWVNPWVDFVRNIASPKAKELITFTNNAICYGGSVCATWDWKFGDGQTGAGNPVSHAYAAPGSYQIDLKVCDNSSPANYCCSKTNQANLIQIVLPLPEWKEVAPF